MQKLSLLASTLLLLAACVGTAPLPQRLYQLSAPALPATSAQLNASVGLGPLKWPDYLNRRQLVLRLDAGRLELLDNDRWAEPLETSFERVLREHILQHAAPQRLQSHPWALTDAPALQVPIEVLQFDSDQQGKAVLRARWRVVARDKSERLSERNSEYRLKAADSSAAAAVAAQSQLLGELGREISAALAALK